MQRLLNAGPSPRSGARALPAERDVLIDWHARDRPAVAGSDGVRYTLSDGRRILDASGMSVASIGHSDAGIAEAAAAQARLLSFCPRQFVSEPQLRLAAKIAEITAEPLTHSWFGPGGGAVGVEAAIHAARHYHLNRGDDSRHKIIAWWGSYHGGTSLTTGIGGYAAHRRPMAPYLAPPGVVLHAGPLPERDGTAGDLAARLEAVIARAGAGSVAAVLVEPVTGSLTGALTGPDGWLAAARQVCRRYGILMIADETMSGFGRTGAWFATDHGSPPAVPDILVAGKLMTSGHFPLTTVTVTAAVARVLQSGPAGWPVRFTNAGHPVACAAALAVISRIERDGLVGNAARQGGYLRGLLADLAAGRPHLGTPTGRGLQLGVPVRRPAGASRADAAGLLADITRAGVQRHGILLTGGTGADGASVKVLFTPPLSVTAADCREIAERFAATVDDVVRRRYGDSAP